MVAGGMMIPIQLKDELVLIAKKGTGRYSVEMM